MTGVQTCALPICIGYLIVYGGQVFKLDLVMMGVVVLAICALIMYQVVNVIEKLYKQKRN